jgi:hypothetical protein
MAKAQAQPLDLCETAHRLRRVGWKLLGLGFLIHQDRIEDLILDETAKTGLGILVEDLGAEVASLSLALDEASVTGTRHS